MKSHTQNLLVFLLTMALSLLFSSAVIAEFPPLAGKGWYYPGWINVHYPRVNSYDSDTAVEDQWFFGQNGVDSQVPIPEIGALIAGSDSVLSVKIPEITVTTDGPPHPHSLSEITFYYGGDINPTEKWMYLDQCSHENQWER
ncbi:MAG: hypothetical protein GY854_31805 [Deltaproteobacteria bacterium]|nr:hypothetical protein [Deltaproteobacteria bacterium]